MMSPDYISRLLIKSAASDEGTSEPQTAAVDMTEASASDTADHASLQAGTDSTVMSREVVIVCCDNSGVVGRFGFDKLFNHELLMLEHMSLESGVFSSPVAFDGCIVVGCRDDHLYCLSPSTVKF